MAKRFTDTDKWKKPFIRGLEAKYKLLWFYILDDCDHAGLWIVDLEIASIRCGFDYSEKDVLKSLGQQIEVIKDGQIWFVRDFIDFQYGTLNESNRAHNSVLNILKKNKIKPLISPLQGVKDKDKDMDEEQDEEQEIKETDFDIFWKAYDYNVGLRNTMEEWSKIKREMPNEIAKILVHVPLYVASKPDKLTRKKPENYLKEGIYNDEIVMPNAKPKEHDFKNFDNVEYP